MTAETETPKKRGRGRPKKDKPEPGPAPEGKHVFTRKGMVKEYHETETTRQLSGCRIVAVSVANLAELPADAEDRRHTQKTRYGRLLITFPIVDDDGKPDVDRIAIPGRLELAKDFPKKKGEAGVWTIALSASDVVAQPVVDRLIELKRSATEVELSFYGSFEQRTLEGMAENQDLG